MRGEWGRTAPAARRQLRRRRVPGQGRRPRSWPATLAVYLLVLTAAPVVALAAHSTPGLGAPASAATDPVIAVGGDVACDIGVAPSTASCQQGATANVLSALGPDAVLPLGDEQYENATAAAFAQVYDPSWGRLKAISHPIPGNHEYGQPGAAAYFDYFGAAAGDRAAGGYYSYDLGAWHVIALNSECSDAPQAGCAAGSPQEQWLRSDLAAHSGRCILAYWHEPRFSSGNAGSNSIFQPFWQDLYDAHADVVLNGHTHAYERFDPQSPTGVPDAAGPREFVVGTGGIRLEGFTTALPNEVVRQNSTFGVMKMSLHSGSFDWQFLPVAGSTWTDSGSATCHNAPPPAATPPSVPTGLQAGAVTATSVPLTWTASTDPGGPGVAGYRVYRNGAATPLNGALVTATGFTDTTVAASTSYSYAVSAVDAAGLESARSTAVAVTTPAAPAPTPAPSGGGVSVQGSPTTADGAGAASASSASIAVPAGAASGEVLVLAVGVGAGGGIPNTPAGWTLITSGHDAGSGGAALGGNIALFRRAVSAEPPSYTVSWPGTTGYWELTMTRLAGVNTAAPVRAVAGQYTNTAYATADTVPALSGVAAGDLSLAYWWCADNAGASIATMTPPSAPWTTLANRLAGVKATVISTATGAQAAPTARTSSTHAIWTAATVAFAAAGT